ncbi:MAG TPA: EF-hand domain-containing protein, partial [Candidatus Thalassarchaeaceae archaeon]
MATFEQRALEGLGKALKSMGYSGADVFKQMDKNGSGNINFGEFKDGIARTTGQNAPDPVLRAVFGLLDSDGTGGISYEEILKLLGEENTALRSAVETVAGNPFAAQKSQSQPATLVVDENFEQGEPIRVGFVASGGKERSWVGIYDSGAKDSDYVDWLYLNGSQEQNYDLIPAGSLTFELELGPGAYDIRLFGDGGYETLLAKTSFAIIEPEPEPEP